MKKKRIIHSALSLSLTAALCLSMAACGGTQTPADSGAASQPAAPSAAVQPSSAQTTSAALPVKALNPKQVEENPYMAKSDANIHHDGYNTDSTDEILPLGIYPEINVSYETTNANASPAIYFDSYAWWGADLTVSGHLHGGIIRIPGIGGIITPQAKLFPRYDAGQFKKNGKNLVVSRGLGTHTVNIRIFNPAELSVIRLKGE